MAIVHPAILTYNISPEVEAFSTQRNGIGVSEGTYGSFNVSPYCNDKEEHVRANLTILAGILGLPVETILLPHQTHGVQCKTITGDFFGFSAGEQRRFLDNTDALVTSLPGVCIGVTTADCVPVLLFDRKRKTTAAIHAGWRGTAGHIVRSTVEKLQSCFRCRPEDIVAVLGPSISKRAFEVGQETYDTFRENGFNMPLIAENISGKWHIDLWQANKSELLEAGVADCNITVCGICTYSNFRNFFSARRLSVNCGRIYTGIVMK